MAGLPRPRKCMSASHAARVRFDLRTLTDHVRIMTDTHPPHDHEHADWTFEAALDRLHEIVGRMEGDDLELDESLALLEEGVRLLRFADGVLEGADARIAQLLDDGAGGTRLDDLPEAP